MRRRVTGTVDLAPPPGPSSGVPSKSVLSPLNPAKARVPSGLSSLMGAGTANGVPHNVNTSAASALTLAQRQRRPPELIRK